MNSPIIARIKQGITYIFGKYDNKWDLDIATVLSRDEFEIFCSMGRYDKIHSYQIFKKVKNSRILSKTPLYYKLALLHDCGKEELSLLRRVKKVLIGDKKVENHAILGFEKLKNINIELASLIRQHHDKTDDIFMSEFQILDSE